MLRDYLVQNWALILVLLAFAISLKTTVLLDKMSIIRLYILIVSIFLLSVVVFLEFALDGQKEYNTTRTILMAVRYSATPVIVAMILFTLVRKVRWFIFIPAIILVAINIISIFTGIVFSLDDAGSLRRGPLGLLPYIVAGLYGVSLVCILYKRCNKLYTEVVPIIFLAFAFASGVFLPFIFGKGFAQMFCVTIAIALLVYYEFALLQTTKKDPLTGVLNRHAYYADTEINPEEITGLVTVDMNGLKQINDTRGHAAGDEALTTLALCFLRAEKDSQSAYRLGGDEFVMICRRASESDVLDLVDRIKKNVAETEYSCSVGYCFAEAGTSSLSDMLKKADGMMYAEKAKYYAAAGKDRRRRSQDRPQPENREA